MAVCSYCYEKTVVTGFDVGEWLNNEPDMVKVCSVEFKDKLWLISLEEVDIEAQLKKLT